MTAAPKTETVLDQAWGASWIVGASAALSRVLGLMRDVLLAAVFGAGPVADALLVGLRLPQLVRRILSEGGAQAAFLPVIVALQRSEKPESQSKQAAHLLMSLSYAVLVICALGIGLRAPLLHALAPGFAKDSEDFRLASMCLGLAFPLIGTSFLTAFATAWLSLSGAVRLASLSTLVVNAAVVAALFAVQHFLPSDDHAALIVAASLTAAGLLQATVLLSVLWRQGTFLARACLVRFWPDWSSLKDLGRRLMPSLIVNAAPQLVFLVCVMQATHWPGGASALIYAERVVQLPFGFIAASLSIVALPRLTALYERGQQSEGRLLVAEAIWRSLALAIPAVIGLVFLAEPIILVLFQYGAFSTQSAAQTGILLQFMACSLPFMAIGRVYGQAFFAQQIYQAPLAASLMGVATALLLCPFASDEKGLALSFCAAQGVEWLVILIWSLRCAIVSKANLSCQPFFKLLFCNGVLALYLAVFADGSDLWDLAVRERLAGTGRLMGVIIGAMILYALCLGLGGLWGRFRAKNSSTTLHDA